MASNSDSAFDGHDFANLIGTIPERCVAKKAKPFWYRAKQASDSLESYQGALKRKASAISSIRGNNFTERHEAEIDYLAVVIEQRKTISEINKAHMSCISEEFKANKISLEQFEVQMRDLTQKQTKLYSGDVAIHRQRDRVLSEVDNIVLRSGKDKVERENWLSSYFYNLLRRTLPGRDAEQIQWRMALYKHYDAQPERHGSVWCPITKHFGPYQTRRAAHLVPYKIGYETMGHLFDGDGYKLMWSMGNGLPMDIVFEQAFDNYDICLLPREVAGKPDEWQLVLMNESLREELAHNEETWDDYDQTFLQFREGCDTRPQKRFLYFHYWMCLVKAMGELTPGWQHLREKTRMGRLWSTPGPYLRKAMVKRLGASIGDNLLPEQEEILKNSFEGSLVPAECEDISVKEVLSVLIPRDDPEGEYGNESQEEDDY